MKKENGVYHKTFYCCDLAGCVEGDTIFDMFLVSRVMRYSNDRDIKWLGLTLEDRSGSIQAKIWADKIKVEYEGFEGQVVLLKGKVTYYMGLPELTVEVMKLMDEEKYALSDVCRMLRPEKIQVYVAQIMGMIEKIATEEIKDFVKSILTEETIRSMATLPVQLRGHHTYRGALLEHVCEVVTAAYYHVKSTDAIREIKCNLDLVLAGALLHDMRSLYLFEADGLSFKAGNIGRLMGSSFISHSAMEGLREKSPLDEDAYGQLVHIIDAAHDGGISPMTLEAMVVRSANRLSIEQEQYENSCRLNELLSGQNNEIFWSKELKRQIYRRKE